MFTFNETKIVFSTLTKRRTLLKKTIAGGGLAEEVLSEYNDTLQHLDSAIQKLAKFGAEQQKKSSSDGGKTTPAVNKKSPGVTLATARVLVAEDNSDSATLLMEILTHEIGLKQIDLAKDGIEAFDRIKNSIDTPYTLILCDWDMPGLSGMEVFRKAKASNTLRGAHFMMVTAMSDADKIREAVSEGIDGYVVKPLDIDILEKKVNSLLSGT